MHLVYAQFELVCILTGTVYFMLLRLRQVYCPVSLTCLNCAEIDQNFRTNFISYFVQNINWALPFPFYSTITASYTQNTCLALHYLSRVSRLDNCILYSIRLILINDNQFLITRASLLAMTN